MTPALMAKTLLQFSSYASGQAYLVVSCTVLTCTNTPLELEKVLAQFASSARGQGNPIFL